MSAAFGLNHPTWGRADCFHYATEDAARTAMLRVYGEGSGHTVVGDVEQTKAKAWDEGYNAGFYDRDYMRTDEPRDATEGRTDNPYESEATQ